MVTSENCSDAWNDGCRERNGYDPYLSSSFVADGQKVKFPIVREHLKVIVDATLGQDSVVVGDPAIKFDGVTFGQMVEVSRMWYEGKNVPGSLGWE